MKALSFLAALAILISFSSCEKLDWDKDHDQKRCGFGEYDEGHKGDYKEYVIEELVKTDKCDCIVQGKVKYVKNGITLAIVDYGDGTCDNLATKTECVKGDCDHEDVKVHEYEMDCDKESKD